MTVMHKRETIRNIKKARTAIDVASSALAVAACIAGKVPFEIVTPVALGAIFGVEAAKEVCIRRRLGSEIFGLGVTGCAVMVGTAVGFNNLEQKYAFPAPAAAQQAQVKNCAQTVSSRGAVVLQRKSAEPSC